jgi:SM-20-related protein
LVSVAADLCRIGISIQDRFVAPAVARQLRECASAREQRGGFAAARIGGSGAERREDGIRSDFTCWLLEPLLPPEIALLQQLEELRLQLNRDAYLGLFELEMHYAKYLPGAGYARHVDQPRGSTTRKLSLVVYLNSGWQSVDGGELRIHQGADEFIDVEPLEGRLVCFLTADREHEVRTARRDRLSISGWFSGRG